MGGLLVWLLTFPHYSLSISLGTKINFKLILYNHTLVLVSFRTCQTLYLLHFDEKKNVLALCASLGVVTLSRTCMSRHPAPEEKNASSLVLAWYSFGICLFWYSS